MPFLSPKARRRVRSAWVRRLLVTVGVIVAVNAHPTAASAHGGTDQAGFSNYEAHILSVSPAVPGLEVTTFGVAGGIKVVNRTDQDVIILGYDNEPYLLINTTGTYVNRNSPATYVNRRRDANVPVPAKAISSSAPDWFQLSYGETVHWHDHRAHWMGSVPPDNVQAAPNVRQIVNPAWTVPMLVAGNPVTITGELVWIPATHRTRWLLVSLLMFVGIVLIMQLFRSTRPLAALALVAALVGNVIIAVSRATTETADASQRLTCFIAAAVALFAFVIGMLNSRHTGPPISWFVTGAVLTGAAYAYIRAFSYSTIDGSASPERIRWAVAIELSAGAAVAVVTLVGSVERRMIRRAAHAALANQVGYLPVTLTSESDLLGPETVGPTAAGAGTGRPETLGSAAPGAEVVEPDPPATDGTQIPQGLG